MDPILVDITVGAAIVTGVVEAVKLATRLDSRYLPVLAILLGVLFTLPGWGIGGGPMAGIIAGLTAGGLYSGGKATVVEPIVELRANP